MRGPFPDSGFEFGEVESGRAVPHYGDDLGVWTRLFGRDGVAEAAANGASGAVDEPCRGIDPSLRPLPAFTAVDDGDCAGVHVLLDCRSNIVCRCNARCGLGGCAVLNMASDRCGARRHGRRAPFGWQWLQRRHPGQR